MFCVIADDFDKRATRSACNDATWTTKVNRRSRKSTVPYAEQASSKSTYSTRACRRESQIDVQVSKDRKLGASGRTRSVLLQKVMAAR